MPEDEWESMAEYLAPFGKTFPGLAESEPDPLPERLLEAGVDSLSGVAWHIAVVGASHPADVLVAIDWNGAANFDFEPALIASVLRSWEKRFEASLCAIEGQELTLVVRRPPQSRRHALAVAAEHYALAPDLIEQGEGSIAEYGAKILGTPLWRPWWD